LYKQSLINPLNAELNPICHMLTLLDHHILHVSGLRVNGIVKAFILVCSNLYHHYFWFVMLCACVCLCVCEREVVGFAELVWKMESVNFSPPPFHPTDQTHTSNTCFIFWCT